MSYEKDQINKIERVAGNIQDYEQKVKLEYLYPTEELCDKISLQMDWADKESGETKAIRSTRFSSIEQLKMLIFKLAEALGYFLEKRDKIGSNWEYQRGSIASEVKKRIEKGRRKAH